MNPLAPIETKPIAIRQAVDAGWHAYRRHPLLFSGFSLLSGGLNLLSQLVFRLAWAAAFTPAGDGSPLALAVAVIALAIYALTGLWLLVGLLRAAELTMDGAPLSPAMVLRPDWPAMGRASGTLALLAVALWGVRELADATASLLVLIQPLLASLPLVARLAVLLYLAADQVLCLPIAVLGLPPAGGAERPRRHRPPLAPGPGPGPGGGSDPAGGGTATAAGPGGGAACGPVHPHRRPPATVWPAKANLNALARWAQPGLKPGWLGNMLLR